MLDHSDLASYVRDLDDNELLAFAARVSSWRKLLLDTGYDETRYLIVRCLVAISNGFNTRGWSTASERDWRQARSPQWREVHRRANAIYRNRHGSTSPNEVRREIARWCKTVRLEVAA